ncbi:unnamed protein product [Anisakis simplex]|uniref:ANF_receptor domain-containing protein n=1 Tax=Anisakis simplex TaxID=6269 RepID=A0A0M3KAG9_ANISI|nr:unnamed protein product [Anisakis simplex]
MHTRIVLHQTLVTAIVIAQLRLGVIESDQTLVQLCKIAIDHATAAGNCKHEVRVFNATGCIDSNGVSNAASLYYKDNVQVSKCLPPPKNDNLMVSDPTTKPDNEYLVQGFIGPNCNDELLGISQLAHFWNIPVFARTSIDPLVSNSVICPTVVQYAMASAAGLSYALKEFADYMNLTEIILVSPKRTNVDEYPIARGIYSFLKSTDLLKVKKCLVIDEDNRVDMTTTEQSIRTSSRCISFKLSFSIFFK